MDDESAAFASRLVDAAYVRQAAEAQASHTKLINILLQHVCLCSINALHCSHRRVQRKLPDVGWPEGTIELFLQQLALMDSNNFIGMLTKWSRQYFYSFP